MEALIEHSVKSENNSLGMIFQVKLSLVNMRLGKLSIQDKTCFTQRIFRDF
jgi:hypothetical protein